MQAVHSQEFHNSVPPLLLKTDSLKLQVSAELLIWELHFIVPCHNQLLFLALIYIISPSFYFRSLKFPDVKRVAVNDLGERGLT